MIQGNASKQPESRFLHVFVFGLIFANYSGLPLYLVVADYLPSYSHHILFFPVMLITLIFLIAKRQSIYIHNIIYSLLLLVIYFLITNVLQTHYEDGVVLLTTDIFRLLSLITIFVIIDRFPNGVACARYGVLIAAIMIVILNFYSLLNPFDILPQEYVIIGRASAFFLNPNTAGGALVISLIICIKDIPDRLKSSFTLFILLGVLATFSRGAIISALLVLLTLIQFRIIPVKNFFVTTSLFFILVLIILSTAMVSLTFFQDITTSNIINRIDWFVTWGQAQDFSSNERLKVALKSLQVINDYPLVGVGVSHMTNWDVSTHNMYLYFGVQYGLLGLFMYPFIILSSISIGYTKNKHTFIPFAVGMLSLGLFSHNILQDYNALVAIAYMAAYGLKGGIGESFMESNRKIHHDFHPNC